MMPTTLKSINLTQKDILQLTILLRLRESSIHGAEIFRFVSESFQNDNLSSNRSKAYVYDSIKEMESQGWIQHEDVGKKKVFSLLKKGEKKIQSFKDLYLPLMLQLEKAVNQMIYNVSEKKFHEVNWSLTTKEKNYLSKLLNVKAMIKWYILHRLHETSILHGGELYREMNQRYAWINSHGYFYQVLREMDHGGYLTSQWADEDTRSKRNYQLTAAGNSQYQELTITLRNHLEELHQFLTAMISRFDQLS